MGLHATGTTLKILEHIKDNTPCSASAQAINKKLGLNIKASGMYKKIRWLKDNGFICEAKGRYYYWSLLPKELEKFI